jgi:hypothetical protein
MVISSGIGSIRHILCFSLLGLSLSACSSIGSLGVEHFTLTGDLPADFSLKAQAHYSAVDPSCEIDRQARSFESGLKKEPHQYRFEIPVSYRAGLCEVHLARIGLFIYGRFGEKDWQQSYDNGGIELKGKLPPDSPTFDAAGRLEKQVECSWIFKLSTAKSRLRHIDKLLSCKGAGAYVESEHIAGKILNMDFKEGGEERPYYRGYWHKSDKGWRPCSGRWGTDVEELCTDPPKFREFFLNDKKCTVYPNCIE